MFKEALHSLGVGGIRAQMTLLRVRRAKRVKSPI
jgi:hypothetical protein